MMFSSVAAVFGSRGQADYAAANENLSTAALRHLPDGVVIHWGAWNDMGMTAGAISTRLADAGAPLLGTIDGVAACVDALAAKTTGEMIVMGASE